MLFSIAILVGLVSADDAIRTPGMNVLNPGQSLWSSSGQYELAMQTDGNLVFYDHWCGKGDKCVNWATNTSNMGNGCQLAIEGYDVRLRCPGRGEIWHQGGQPWNVDYCVGRYFQVMNQRGIRLVGQSCCAVMDHTDCVQELEIWKQMF